MKSTKLNMISEANGAVVISNDDSTITIQPDGTISISSYAPVQLTGMCMAKLDNSGCGPEAYKRVTQALEERIPNKKSN